MFFLDTVCCVLLAEAPGLPPRPTLGHPLYHYVVQGPHALALFDYTTSHSDELSFSVCYCASAIIFFVFCRQV